MSSLGNIVTFNSATDAYRAVLECVRDHGQGNAAISHRNSPGQGDYKSVRNLSFRIENPRDRHIVSTSREFNKVAAAATLIWYMRAETDSSMVAFYNYRPVTKLNNKNGEHDGSYGHRLYGGDNLTKTVLDKLAINPETRRASVMVLTNEDIAAEIQDVPCLEAMHWNIQNGRLNLSVNMRSNSAAMVLPYNLWAFTMIQEMEAVKRGLKPGNYTHYAVDMHTFVDQEALVVGILKEESPSTTPMPPIQDASDKMRGKIIACEEEMRTSLTSTDDFDSVTQRHGIDDYWKEQIFKPMAEYCVRQHQLSPA